eukprot:TRINITY_DN3268_c0_g1_i1.p1 TRINITY_DN3268_c0_g1~~TRINITY_DN3268_c0_g1_i1.p1  ORF type:complete len:194 (+),score=28.85 TRINITY_DN3268_c0_g1_i1:25-582(+)
MKTIDILILLGGVLYTPILERIGRHKSSSSRELINKNQSTDVTTSQYISWSVIFICNYLPIVVGHVHPSLDLSENIKWILFGIILLGYYVRYTAMRTLGKYFTRTLKTEQNQKVIQEGIYSYVRHPGYLGNAIVWLPYNLGYSQNIWCLSICLILITVYTSHRTFVEEDMMVQQFGDAYRKYQKS